MAKATIRMPKSFLMAVSALADRTDEIVPKVDDIGRTSAEELTGAATDDNGVLISSGEDIGSPVAVGFRAQKANGKYRYFWLYRVKFGIPATNLQTKGDSISFQTPTIEGTVMRRNKLDGQGKHPWKAEATEGDAGVAPVVVQNWYTQVYEPSFAGEGPTEPMTEEE